MMISLKSALAASALTACCVGLIVALAAVLRSKRKARMSNSIYLEGTHPVHDLEVKALQYLYPECHLAP